MASDAHRRQQQMEDDDEAERLFFAGAAEEQEHQEEQRRRRASSAAAVELPAAGALDIVGAPQQQQQPFQLGQEEEEEADDYDDPDGAMFSGPYATSVPRSVSAFRPRSRSRPELDRYLSGGARSSSRLSRRSGRSSRASSFASVSTTAASGDDDDGDDDPRERVRSRASARRARRLRRASVSSEASAAAPASSAASRLLSGISRVVSRRSEREDDDDDAISIGRSAHDDDDDDPAVSLESADEFSSDDGDPYGPYGSDGDSDDSRFSADHEHQRRGTKSFFDSVPGLSGGGDMFGGGDDDGATDADAGASDDGSFEPALFDDDDEDTWPDGTRRRRAQQAIYIPDEDLQLYLVGLRVTRLRAALWATACILSAGSLWLISRWVPRIWIRAVATQSTSSSTNAGSGSSKDDDFAKAHYIVVESAWHEPHVLPLGKTRFTTPVPLDTVFPASLEAPPAHRDDVAHPNYAQDDEESGQDGSTFGSAAPDSRFDLTNGAAGGGEDTLPRAQGAKATPPAVIKELKSVNYRYYKLLLHPGTGDFRLVRDWKDPKWTSGGGVSSLRVGLRSATASFRERLFGQNAIEIEARSVPQLLVDEVLHPFYVFQIASILLWSLDDYYYYAFAIAVISIASITTTLIETRKNVERMRDMSRYTCEVSVKRDGAWQTMDSAELVPGDVVDVSDSSLNTFPADFVLLSGDAIVNESMLTGESVPISKVPLESKNVELLTEPGSDLPAELARHALFSGTRIVRVRKVPPSPGAEPEAIAMVLRTGFNTTKGALVRSMLFPKPFGFSFYRDSFRFIGVLAMIAVIGFLASSYNFVRLGIDWPLIVVRALDLVTIVVPPALPATMSIGTSFAIQRLRKRDIFCISPNRVNIGGKINMVCFDKTGTLTEEGLDVLGVRTVMRSNNAFSELFTEPDVPTFGAADAKTPLLHALATCHALKLVDGEVIGDPLDLRMFEFTGWALEEGAERAAPSKPTTSAKPAQSSGGRVPDRAATLVQTVVRPPGGASFRIEDALKAGTKHAHFLELGILRTLEFTAALRRMSVLVKKLKSNSVEAYVKGAPEVMREICDPATLPADYDQQLAFYTKHGYRVIALAGKSLQGLTWVKAQRLKREQVESDLRFLGLIIFENKLKPGSAPALASFRGAHIPTRMVTGDNVRTAISVGRECDMLQGRVFIPHFAKGAQTTPRAVIEWTDIDDDDSKLDPYTLRPYEPSSEPYALAVTGDVFRWTIDFAALETVQRMLVKGVVWARMSPDEKHELVERLQSLGYTVGFCGDGANDCGALKAADVGLSLSEAEASVAAPFTSRQQDIRCFLDVIKEGRAALVTSFSCFKFMALYSLIQFTTVTLLYSIASTLGDFQFLYIDLFLILPIAVTMGRTEPYPRIHPKRPTSNLVSKKVLSSLLGQVVLTSGFQLFTFFFIRAQPWYKAPTIDPDDLDIVSYENTALFVVSTFQYILVAAVFCVGPPYRKPIMSNRWLVFVLAALLVFSVYVLFSTHGPIFLLLELITLPHDFHLELMLVIIANAAACFAYEQWGAMRVSRFVGNMAKRIRRARGRRRDSGKIYKSVAADLSE